MNTTSPIGVFDSGIGGLSILKALRVAMPAEHFVYFADSAHSPYGEKKETFVAQRSLAITRQLVQTHNIKALVVACNTATAVAIAQLRSAHPGLPIIGVEPALKPALALSRTKRIGVLATRATLASAKFATLLQFLNAQAEFVCTPCDGLAEQIERCQNAQDVINLGAYCAGFIKATGQFGTKNGLLDSLVLGCTHYPLALPHFRQAVGAGVNIVDNGAAVARRTAALLGSAAAPVSQQGEVSWLGSGDMSQLLNQARHWFAA